MIKFCLQRLILFVFCLYITVPIWGQQVTLNLHGVTVKHAMHQFKQATGYSFIYFSTDVDVRRKINVIAKHADITEAVEQILKGQNVVFQIKGKSIIVQRAKDIEVPKQSSNIKMTTASGKVFDRMGHPLAGVTVLQRGFKKETITDADGNFSLEIPVGSVLEFSSLGYIPRKVKATNNIQLKMEENVSSLDDIIIIGYGSLTRKETTSAISHVNAERLARVSSIDAGTLLLGKVSGLSVENIGIGDPNELTSLQIRGISSRSAGLKPLIVVDDIPVADLTNINAIDIESIDILKDGAASAIYGTRASNGVIIVNLKKELLTEFLIHNMNLTTH